MRKYYYLYLFLILTLCSCNNTPDMVQLRIDNLTPLELSEHYAPAILLDSFESPPCGPDVVTANVYRVKLLSEKDTTYVFEVCKDMFVGDNMSSEKNQKVFIVVRSEHDTRQVLIPKKSKIQSGAKYIFGSLKEPRY